MADQVRELIAIGAATGASCETCLKYHVKNSGEVGLTAAQMREAIAIGLRVREASGKAILTLGEKLLPQDSAPTAPGSGRVKATTGGCC